MKSPARHLSPSRAAGYFAVAGIVLAVLGGVGFIAAATFPVAVEMNLEAQRARHIPPMPGPPEDVRPLMARVAGRRLIMPAQGLPAVKDSGAAQKLLERLKLQGVAKVGDEMVAYVAVKGGGAEGKGSRLQTVRARDQLLAFTVESVEPGRVTLSLEGVMIELRG